MFDSRQLSTYQPASFRKLQSRDKTSVTWQKSQSRDKSRSHVTKPESHDKAWVTWQSLSHVSKPESRDKAWVTWQNLSHVTKRIHFTSQGVCQLDDITLSKYCKCMIGLGKSDKSEKSKPQKENNLRNVKQFEERESYLYLKSWNNLKTN